MKKINLVTSVFLVLVSLAFLNIAIQAFLDPQTIMDMVSVELNNLDARNSTRAYYGGVNLSIALFLIFGAFKMRREALIVLALYGGGFVIGRVYSILADGMPGSFATTWLIIESVLTLIACILLKLQHTTARS